ncbi:unnamed protein product [Rotaria magnacalcarata]
MAEFLSCCLVCPITFSLFRDPVIAEDGHTYERESIIKWIKHDSTSPLTREQISIAGLRPNHTVRNLVSEFRKSLSTRNYKFKLGVDIKRLSTPFFQSTGKALFEAQWIGYPNGPRIVLLKLFGARAEKEASFYEQLTRHPHVVYTYGLVEQPDAITSTYIFLLQEMAPLGSLVNVLDQHAENHPNKPLSDKLLNHIFLQISDAMIFLSSKSVIHGDLACRNILVFHFDVDDPHRTLVKLTDFGISRGNSLYSKIDAVQTAIDVIPIRSSAPEVLENNIDNPLGVYSEKSDMFAMGVLMWETYSNGKTPWGEVAREQVVRKKVIDGERLSRPENCKSDCQWNLILKCMSQDCDDRPTFEELAKELKEFIDPANKANLKNSYPLVKNSKSLPSKQEEQEKIDEPSRSSFVIQETKSISSDDHPEKTNQLGSSTGNYVKAACNFFEKKIIEQKQPLIDQRSKSMSKLASLNVPKITEKSSPREELIKLIKWH